jgi:hypothetical protein
VAGDICGWGAWGGLRGGYGALGGEACLAH